MRSSQVKNRAAPAIASILPHPAVIVDAAKNTDMKWIWKVFGAVISVLLSWLAETPPLGQFYFCPNSISLAISSASVLRFPTSGGIIKNHGPAIQVAQPLIANFSHVSGFSGCNRRQSFRVPIWLRI